MGIARPDVALAKPGYPGNPVAGFEAWIDPAALARRRRGPAAAVDRRHRQQRRRDGARAQGPDRLRGVRPLDRRRATPARGEPPFRVLPALSGIGIGDARGLETRYQSYVSPTVGVGLRVPILYLRTTRGAAADFAFDPDWDIERRCGAPADRRRLAVRNHRAREGEAAAAAGDAQRRNLGRRRLRRPGLGRQRSPRAGTGELPVERPDAVMADDALSHLPGSQAAPELGAVADVQRLCARRPRYKRRNLQQAARLLAGFARAHPDLFVGVNLDPDSYLNPFFEEKQWYDYNPGTLRQFRHWLAGSGPYAGRPDAPGVPDLSGYRRARPLSLAEVSALSGRSFARWNDVDPPRVFPRAPRDGRPAFADDPWTREWGALPPPSRPSALRRARALARRRRDPAGPHLVVAGLHGTARDRAAFRGAPRQPEQELRHRRNDRRRREAARRSPGRDPLRSGRRQRHPDGGTA